MLTFEGILPLEYGLCKLYLPRFVKQEAKRSVINEVVVTFCAAYGSIIVFNSGKKISGKKNVKKHLFQCKCLGFVTVDLFLANCEVISCYNLKDSFSCLNRMQLFNIRTRPMYTVLKEDILMLKVIKYAYNDELL